MIKFIATYNTYNPTIEEIDVERETEKFVIVKVGLSEVRVQKTSSWKNVRDTYEEALERINELFKYDRDKIISTYENTMKISVNQEKLIDRL